MKRSIVNPLIEEIARLVYQAKKNGYTSITLGKIQPDHVETEHAMDHFNALPHTKAVLKQSPQGRQYLMISWLNEVED